MSATSSTGTDIARIPAGISRGITPEVFSPMKSLLTTTGSLATNWLLAKEPTTAFGSVKAPCGTPSRAHLTSLTESGASFSPSGMSRETTTTSTVWAIARCTSDSRFLSAEKTTIAARIAPSPASRIKMIGRLIYAPLLHAAFAEHAPQIGQNFIRSLAHHDLRRAERSWKRLREAEPVEERGHARDDGVGRDVVGDGHRDRLSEAGLHDGHGQVCSVAGGERRGAPLAPPHLRLSPRHPRRRPRPPHAPP